MSFGLALLWSAVACVTAAPAPTGVVPLEKEQFTVIPILSQFEDLEANGTYKFSYETGNGITREETSYNKLVPQVEGRAVSGGSSDSVESNEIHVQVGSFSYVAPDGTVISLRYTADENGFRPVGDHLPTPPPFVRHQINYANEKSGRSLKFSKPTVSESSPTPVKTSVVVEKKSDIVTRTEEVKETKTVPEKKPESEVVVNQPQEVKKIKVEPEKNSEVKSVVTQPEDVKETNIVAEKKSVVEAIVTQPEAAKSVLENKLLNEVIVAQPDKESKTATPSEKKPEIAAIDLAISVNPLKESNIVSTINEIPSIKVSLTTTAVDSSVKASTVKPEEKKTTEVSATSELATKDAVPLQVTEAETASEKKTVAEEPPSTASENPISDVLSRSTDKVVVELVKAPEQLATVDSTQSTSKIEEKSTAGESA